MSADKRFSGGHGEKKARKLDQFVAAMLAHPTVEAAATSVGIAASTAYRWLQDETVIRRLAEARRNAMEAAMSRLQANATRAADNLDELQRTAESEAVRLAASRANLEFAFRTVEIIDVLKRLDAIERKINSPNWRGNEDQPNFAQTNQSRTTNGAA
jgi:hypothetical protein